MKKAIWKAYVTPLVLVTLMAACSRQQENANNSTAPSSPVAQNGTVPANSEASSPPVAAPSAQPALTPAEGAKVETDKAALPKVSAGPAAQPAPSGPSPKLVVPAKKVDFGKQPQSKSLARAITIRNGGKAPLKIDAVEPS
jgi:hypothetical protein